jgi:hypothetical protein
MRVATSAAPGTWSRNKRVRLTTVSCTATWTPRATCAPSPSFLEVSMACSSWRSALRTSILTCSGV